MALYQYALIISAGAVAGFINTLAGSGSLITLPTLILLGLPSNIANGTNRIAILLQNVVGGASFRRAGVLDTRAALILSAPAMLGAVLGAAIAVELEEALLRQVIGGLMALMLVILLLRPARWLHGSLERMQDQPRFTQLVIFFGIGIYGGFIQAGVGFMLLAGLVLSIGFDLVRANAVKVVIVLFFTLSALVVFIANDQVDWLVGLILAIGNMLGAWFAARFALQRGAVWVRRVMIAVVAFFTIQMLGIPEALRNLLF